MRASGAPSEDAGNLERLPASLTAFGATPSPATAVVVRQSLGRRATRAAVALGVSWAAGVVAVFIPLAHFVLVPAALVVGIALAAGRLREETRLLAVHATCPRCGREQDFEASGRFGGSRTIDCPHCRNQLTLRAA